MSTIDWYPDILPGYQSHQWELNAPSMDGEPDVGLTATLVRAGVPNQRRAVLYLHGWNDYFFQTHLADFFVGQGFDFYALDLRRYGRNLQPGLYAGFIGDLADYDDEISYAMTVINADHSSVILIGHSTGGLTASIWAGRNPGAIDGLVLNAPWLDMHGSFPWTAAQTLLMPLMKAAPTKALTRSSLQLTKRATHISQQGEWEYNTDWKGTPAFATRFGWINAVLNAQEEVARGLNIDVPILAMMSAKSVLAQAWDDELLSVDFVLEVDKLAAATPKLGNHLTLIRFPGALHDVVLSKQPVRGQVFAELSTWLTAYLGE